MKTLLLSILTLVVVSGNAQSGAKKKRTYKSIAATSAFDSATYYYNLGWDNYKMDSLGNDRFGPARYYWEKASLSQGSWASKNAALFRLGIMQQNGEGMEVNLTAALDFYTKASGTEKKLGDADAIKTIGGMYENGVGVDINYGKALAWYQKAKRAGNQYVDEDIARLKDRMSKK